MYEDIKKWGSLIQESVDKEAEYKKQVEAYEAEMAKVDSVEDIELGEAEDFVDWASDDVMDSDDPEKMMRAVLDIVLKAYNVKLDILTMHGPGGGWPEVKVSGSQFVVDKFMEDFYSDEGLPDPVMNEIDKLFKKSARIQIQNSDNMKIADEMTVAVETPSGSTQIKLDGDAETNEWLIDILSMAFKKNPSKSSINFYLIVDESCNEDDSVKEDEEDKIEESNANEIHTLKQLKKAISRYGSAEQDMKVILADTTGKKYQITEVNVIPTEKEDIIGIDIDEVNAKDILS